MTPHCPDQIPRAGRQLIAVLLALFSLGGCEQQTTAQNASQKTTPVTVVTLKTQPVILTRELPGRAVASLVAEIRPQVDGIVQRRLFTEGGKVKAGQTLYQLDDAIYRADLGNSEAALARAQATLHAARLTAVRSAELVKINAISRQDDENAGAALHQAEADLKAAKAAVDRNRILLDYARITAPISGQIGKSSVTQGALVNANQTTALATVQQLDPIYIDLNQSSSELLQLRKALAAGSVSDTRNVPVSILLEDGSTYPHTGKLAFSDLSVDPGTSSYSLRIVVSNPEHLLLPGTYVRALVSYGERKEGILVPQQGISRDAKGNAFALVVDKDNKVRLRQVQASRSIGDQWLVDSGLAAGERVIVEGLQKVSAGAMVQASEATITSNKTSGTQQTSAAAPQP